MRTDKELLDALDAEGCGVALLHDDDRHWYVVTDGLQDAFVDGPKPFATTHIIDPELVPMARQTAREAINAWIDANEACSSGVSDP